MVKSRIVGVFGERALALPAVLDAALTASERAKYVRSLLQMAASHADDPERRGSNLGKERVACGLAEACLDHVTADAMSDGKGNYAIPKESAHIKSRPTPCTRCWRR